MAFFVYLLLQNPCWLSDNSLKSYKNPLNLWAIYLSNILLIEDKLDIGLSLFLSLSSPYLNIGMTLAILSVSGKHLSWKHKLIMWVRGYQCNVQWVAAVLVEFHHIQVLFVSKDFKYELTSSLVTGYREKNFRWIFDKLIA